ncbi:MAG: type II toxin-antitoxin system PemK/MazF family toxin [Gallionellaceae bacterium]|nr:type II toxin-antitoxin system PemK/MazF family toxin [Gallionellaceae bacterium]
MKRGGQIVLATFPYTDLSDTRLRPVLMLRQASTNFDDWLVCMVSSQIQQAEEGLDEIITPADADFSGSGLKAPSILRLSRLTVLDGKLLVGSIGTISDERLMRIRQRLAKWINEAPG